jgi:NADH-quinone oxidoreductase subunit L
VVPALWLARIFWKIVDIQLIDALLPNGAAYLSVVFGKFVNRLQSGLIYNYTFLMILAIVIMVSAYAINF